MGLIELKCQSCGAVLQKSDDRDFFFCEYCGAKLTFEKINVEVSGTVKIDGIAGIEELFERASILLQSQKFYPATAMYEKVLELQPKCAQAYWGKLLCEYSVCDPEWFINNHTDITQNSNYRLAVSFADGNEKSYYESIGERSAAAYEKFISGTRLTKKLSRIALYISVPVNIIFLFMLSELLDNRSYDELHNTGSFFYIIKIVLALLLVVSSLVARLSNKRLVAAKQSLGETPINIFRFYLGFNLIFDSIATLSALIFF